MRENLIGTRDRMVIRRVAAGLVMCLALLVSSGCAYPTLREIAAEINATLAPPPTFLLPNDQVSVAFPRKPEWNQTVTVRGDGRATFLFLEERVVAGMTMAKLHEELSAEYTKKGVLDPVELTINLVNVAVRSAVVMGEVRTPGVVDIEGGHLSLLEAIGRAGGHIKDTADLSEALLVRWMPGEGKVRTWYFDASLEYWGSGTPILLQSHDMVFIPNTTIDEINIWVDKYIRQMIPIPGFTPAAVAF